MDCKEVRSLISAYLDAELDARSSLEMEQHFATCKQCEAALNAVRDTKRIVKSEATYFRAPTDLRQKLQRSIEPPIISPRPFGVKTFAFAACLALALGVGWMLGRDWNPADSGSEIFTSHLRALMSDHLADVISTDKHTVKPWFNGKLDFSPPVNDFTKQGFPLTGGRLEYMDGKRVAVLVYKRAKHIIDLYIAPATGTQAQEQQTTSGFNQIHWKQGGFEFWAISDLNMVELSQFAQLCRQPS